MRITDKIRLDYLTGMGWTIWNIGGKRGEWRIQSTNGIFLGVGATPRRAIDAAIKSDRARKKGE